MDEPKAGALRQWSALTLRGVAHAQGTSTEVAYSTTAGSVLRDALAMEHRA